MANVVESKQLRRRDSRFCNWVWNNIFRHRIGVGSGLASASARAASTSSAKWSRRTDFEIRDIRMRDVGERGMYERRERKREGEIEWRDQWERTRVYGSNGLIVKWAPWNASKCEGEWADMVTLGQTHYDTLHDIHRWFRPIFLSRLYGSWFGW